MPRTARVIIPDIPYHVTHRGNHREKVFLDDDNYRQYLKDIKEGAERYRLEIWAYCLMPNHIHLIAAPKEKNSLAGAIRLAHARHARRIHKAQGWTGHLWANRFFSCGLDSKHLWHAVKYVELNPVRAALASSATDWPWSSARAHSWSETDDLLSPNRPFPGHIKDWSTWLAQGLTQEDMERLRRHTRTGRPLGDISFIELLENLIGRLLRPKKRGPKPKEKGS